jgi:FkbM family methyltransferase
MGILGARSATGVVTLLVVASTLSVWLLATRTKRTSPVDSGSSQLKAIASSSDAIAVLRWLSSTGPHTFTFPGAAPRREALPADAKALSTGSMANPTRQELYASTAVARHVFSTFSCAGDAWHGPPLHIDPLRSYLQTDPLQTDPPQADLIKSLEAPFPELTLIAACPQCATPFVMAVPSPATLAAYGYAGGNVQEELIRARYWDMQETQVAATILEHGCTATARESSPLMVDIGANTGYFSLMALASGCRVHAFEPTKYHKPYHTASVALSRAPGTRHYTFHDRVVSSVSGQHVPFDTWNVAESAKKQVKDTIESIRVDDVVREDVLYLKMDIEGHEPEGFRGLSELLRRHQVDFILWEHTPHYYSTLDKETPPAAILRDLGYWVSELHHGGSGNYIAAHPKANAVLRRRIMEKD